MIVRLILGIIFFTFILSTGFLTETSIVSIAPDIGSTSPLNTYLYGTSEIFQLSSSRWRVETIDSIWILEGYDKAAYIVIGPDKPFTDDEIAFIKELLSEGRLNILIADETEISNSLISMVSGIALGINPIIRLNQSGGWEYIYRFECRGYGGGLGSKASLIHIYGEGWTPICRALGVYRYGSTYVVNPIVAAYKDIGNGSRIIVISDSSICINYIVRELGSGYGNPDICMELIRLISSDGQIPILFDVSHYRYADISTSQVINGLKTFLLLSSYLLRYVGSSVDTLTLYISGFIVSIVAVHLIFKGYIEPKAYSMDEMDRMIIKRIAKKVYGKRLPLMEARINKFTGLWRRGGGDG